MNALETAIEQAIASQGELKQANKAYLEFIKANFILPIEKQSASNEPDVLYFIYKEQVFLPVFSSRVFFDTWAQEVKNDIQLLELTGVNLLKGLGDDVTVCMNIGSPLYKEFNPSELARMRSMVLKLFK